MPKSHWIPVFVLLISSAMVDGFLFEEMFKEPNRTVFTVGGDGFIINFNMNYHIRYGEGAWLTSMNYPRGELLFMTDSQGSLSVLLSWINSHLFPVEHVVIGINNGLLIYLLPVASLFLWLTLLRFKVSAWFAIPFAIWITYMAPQISRIGCGHYGLGYVFFIPLLIWWAVQSWQKRAGLDKAYLLLVLPIMLFIGFNNPYLLAIGCSFLLAFGLVAWVSSGIKTGWKSGGLYFIAASLPLLIVLITLKTLDPFHDRLDVPWGFFTHRTDWTSLFIPSGGHVRELLAKLIDLPLPEFEGRAYLGIISGSVLILSLAGALISLIGTSKSKGNIDRKSGLWILLSAGFLTLLYAFRLPLYDFLKPISGYISFLLQFRAPGRFAWIFYFCASIYVVVVLWDWYSRLKVRSTFWATVFFISSLLTWGWDACSFAKSQISQRFENPFNSMENRYGSINEILESEKYQAMLQLPLDQGWAKFNFESWWPTQFQGILISTYTGLPFLNARLSRIPVSHSLASVELISDPIIEKTILHALPDDRPILLVVGENAPLSSNESLLLELADTVFVGDGFFLSSLALTSLGYFEDYRKSVYRNWSTNGKVLDSGGSSTPLAYVHFDDQKGKWNTSFFGGGAYSPPPGRSVLWQGNVPESFWGKKIDGSFWIYGDHEHDGSLMLNVIQLDKSGEEVKRNSFQAIHARDSQRGWIRLNFPVKLEEVTKTLELEIDYDFKIMIDELLIQEEGDTVAYPFKKGGDSLLINNFIVRKPPSE